jgi:uracil-DNA glycosylase family 4
MASKKAKLDDLQKQILDDDPTPELRKGATQLVFGDGNPDSEMVFIGEAPGKNEDKEGIPFIGAAGKFLNEMLQNIDLKREDIYITNIVKYRPPNNRDPLPAEKQAFMKYLESQLEVIQPVLTITLGRHSLNCFLPDLSISACHGQPKRYKGRVYLPLFHPAAALYNGAMRQTLIDDFSLIPAITKKIKASLTN